MNDNMRSDGGNLTETAKFVFFKIFDRLVDKTAAL